MKHNAKHGSYKDTETQRAMHVHKPKQVGPLGLSLHKMEGLKAPNERKMHRPRGKMPD